MTTTLEASAGGERGGVAGSEDVMRARVDEPLLRARVSSPEQENDAVALAAEVADDTIRELLPSLARVRTRSPLAYREARVEQEDALLRPACEVAVSSGPRACLFEYVDQAGRRSCPFGDRECQTHGLLLAVVRVLPKNDDSDFTRFYELKRSESVRPRRVDEVR